MLSLNRAQNNIRYGLPEQHLYKLAQLSTGTDAAFLLLVSSIPNTHSSGAEKTFMCAFVEFTL